MSKTKYWPARREMLGYLESHPYWQIVDGRWVFGSHTKADVPNIEHKYVGQWPYEIAEAEGRDVDAVMLDIRHHTTQARLEKLEGALESLSERDEHLRDAMKEFATGIENAFSELADELNAHLADVDERLTKQEVFAEATRDWCKDIDWQRGHTRRRLDKHRSELNALQSKYGSPAHTAEIEDLRERIDSAVCLASSIYAQSDRASVQSLANSIISVLTD